MPVGAFTSYNSGASSVLTHTIPLPSADEGDAILLVVGCDTTISSPTATNFTLIYDVSTSGGRSTAVFALLAGSTAQSSADFSAGNNSFVIAHAYTLSGVDPDLSKISFATSNGNGFESPLFNPPSLTASQGNVEYLWFAGSSSVNAGAGYTEGPTNYTALLTHNANSTDPASLGTAYRLLTAETEDPGPFTSLTGGNSGTFTLAIPTVAAATGPDYTARKGSTETITHALTADGITTATLNGETVTIGTQSGQDADIALDETAITTSGEYDLVLGDGVDTETFTVQYNVVGLPSNTLLKDGAVLASLTDVKLTVLDASGTRLDRQTGLTTDASGLTGVTPVAAGAVDDPVEVSFFSPGSEVGIVYETTLGLL